MYSFHRNRIYFFILTYEDVCIFCICCLVHKDAQILRTSKCSIKMLLESNDYPFKINPFKIKAVFFCKS